MKRKIELKSNFWMLSVWHYITTTEWWFKIVWRPPWVRIKSYFKMRSRAGIPQIFQFTDNPECPGKPNGFLSCHDTQRSYPTEMTPIMGEYPRGIWQSVCTLPVSTPSDDSQLGPGPRKAVLPTGPVWLRPADVHLLVVWLVVCFATELYFLNWLWRMRWGLTWPQSDIYMTCFSLKKF